jgi:hypothetical protein
MKLLTQYVPKNWRLYVLGDLHAGTVMFHESAFVKAIGSIKRDPNARVILQGDMVEAIAVDDKRFQYDSHDPEKATPRMQEEYLIKVLAPIKDKIVAILMGNHEYKLKNYTDITHNICNGIGIPERNGTYTCKVNFVNEDTQASQFKGFFTHGSRNISTSADDPVRQESNLKLSLKRLLKDKAGDCLVMARGHSHKLILSEPEKRLYLTDDGKDIEQHYTKSRDISGGGYIHPDHRYYICSGSFLKLYGPSGVSGYAERAEYDPVELGYVKLSVRNNEIVKAEKVII